MQRTAEEDWKDKANLGGHSLERNSWSELGPGAVGGDSPEPGCSLRLRNNRVNPGQGNTRQRHLRSNMRKSTRENSTAVRSQREYVGEALTGKGPDQIDTEATEARPTASTGAKVGDGAAETVGNGNRLDFDDISCSRGIVILLVRVVVVVLNCDEDGRLRFLDRGQCRNNKAVSVLDLSRIKSCQSGSVVSSLIKWMVTHRDGQSKKHHAGHDDHPKCDHGARGLWDINIAIVWRMALDDGADLVRNDMAATDQMVVQGRHDVEPLISCGLLVYEKAKIYQVSDEKVATVGSRFHESEGANKGYFVSRRDG